jgi:hypothetical protein
MDMKDQRLEKIMELLVSYTQGNYSEKGTISDKGDELDAIILGLNTLAEELASKK